MGKLIELAIRDNVAPCFLEYIGKQDESKTIGVVLYCFNVFDEQHVKYKSTIALMKKVS